jgi:type IV pilus assembly protein PilY1
MSKKSFLPVSALLRAASFVLVAGTAAVSWAQTPAQIPLLSRVSNPPNPNVFIDIDDSGSMQAHYMPEGEVHIFSDDSKNPSLPTLNSMCTLIDVFRGDQQDRGGYQNGCTRLPAGVSYAIPNNASATGAVFQRQMRSADVNSIFYNPAVLYLPWQYVDANGNVLRKAAGVYTAAYWNPADTTLGTVDLSANLSNSYYYCPDSDSSDCASKTVTYDPGLFYVLNANGDPKTATGFTEYDLNGSATTFPASAARVCTVATNSPCCASAGATGCTKVQERQNFANWFVYYRTRTHLVKGSLSEALPNVVGKVRVGWGTINTAAANIDGKTTGGVVKAGVRELTTTQLGTLLTGIQNINPYNGTPLRGATVNVGNYFMRTDIGSPWANTPGTDGTVSSCRRSYHLMTTDGYWNDNSPNVGDVDSTKGPDYSGATANPLNAAITRYLPGNPYQDGQSNMLADVAMKYYVTDLQPLVDNRETPNDAVGDIAYWQHLSMFTVGLGVRGTLDPSKDLPAVPNWGSDKIDDLWHAAVDTHGAFFSAKDSTSLAQALTTALGSAASSIHNESGASTSGASLTTNTYEYLPVYQSVQWTGNVSSYLLDPVTGAPAATATWIASRMLPSWDQRNIWTSDGLNNSAVFDTTLSSTLKGRLTSVVTDQNNLINYLRGDKSNEGATGLRARVRESGYNGVLGDFIDSPPTLVDDLVDLKYDNIAGTTSYRDYYNNTKATRSYGVLFEGSNDGMLHAFRATDGVELYAYVPYATMGGLSVLSTQSYGSSANFHRDFVDGPQTETDAFVPTKRNAVAHWANLLFGSYGSGAKGFYALDTTTLTTFDGSTLLWESAADNDVGYIYENIQVGPFPDANTNIGSTLKNGAWKAFIGNGAYSTNGNAVLLIVDVATGNIDQRVVLDQSGNNGLMGVSLLRDANNAVVAAYAGDLKGNFYRIEFTGNNAPVESFNKQPLFKAVSSTGVAQPITARPLIYRNPLGGNTVLFGTGRLIDVSDADSTAQQTFYGIWDKTAAGASAETTTGPFATTFTSNTERTLLQVQTITSAGPGLYNVTKNALDTSKQYGWYMDLDAVSSTQRVLYSALTVGADVLINTSSPAPLSSDPCMQTSGTSTFFMIGATDGTASDSPVWDINGDGKIDSNDSAAEGYTTNGAGQNTVVNKDPNDCVNVTAGGNKVCQPPQSAPASIHKRVWQQILTPPF